MIDKIKEKLIRANTYFLLPVSLKSAPLPFSDFKKEDGSYYSVNELAAELGSLFIPKMRINNKFILFRYGVDFDYINAVTQYLESTGLINIRKNEDNTLKLVSELDFSAFKGNEFLIVPLHMVNDIPVNIETEDPEDPEDPEV